MAKLIDSALCNRVIVDQQTNTVSLIDLIEEGVVPQIPIPLPPFTVFMQWERESTSEAVAAIRITLSDPQKVVMLTQDIVQPFDNKRIRTILQVPGWIVNKQGVHTVTIHTKSGSKWKLVESHTIDIHLQGAVVQQVPLVPAKPKA